MPLQIKKDPNYAESSITFVGLTRYYGRPQYILVNSDKGKNPKLKFPGLRFRAPKPGQTLEDVAVERFQEQTGLEVQKSLGLRAVMPTRSRHNNQWIFRNIFLGLVEGTETGKGNDGRQVYVADLGQGIRGDGFAFRFGDTSRREPIEWVAADNQVISRIATDIAYHFDWSNLDTSWFKRIPCISVPPQTETDERRLGCGLAVSSMLLVYRPNESEIQHTILIKRKGDTYPGYAGGKIETPKSVKSLNLDPISCCAKEGAEEFGFSIQPLGLIGVACTPTEMHSGDYHNSIVNYCFVARPTNLLQVRDALKHPEKYLEGKMESYVVETLDEFRDRIKRDELRMPDMPYLGNSFFNTEPGEKIPLTQIIDSGVI